jgi:uncharacterized protein YneR
MNLEITNEAAQWYKSEMALSPGDKIRFFVRYGGCSTVQSGFSLGVDKIEPFEVGAETSAEGITFFVEEKDLWYFNDHDFLITFNQKLNEPVFEYSRLE